VTDVLATVGTTLPFAVGIAISPIPLVAIVLLLLSPGGKASGVAFLIGRVLGVVVVVGVFAAISELIERSDSAAPAMGVVRILVGIGLIVLAVRKWGGRPGSDDEPELPGWMSAVEGSSPAKSFRLALILSLANPKELLLNIGAGLTIGDAALAMGPTIGVAGIYTVIACLSVAGPVVAFAVAAQRMRAPLESARAWLVRNNAAIASVVLLVIGAVLIGGGLGDL
jgi:threonine/homoserine/homoserine lactone efflux protein